MDLEDEADQDVKRLIADSAPSSPHAAAKRELPSEDEETPPPPKSQRPPEVKRRRFFAQEVNDDEEQGDVLLTVKEKLSTLDKADGKVDKGKGRATEPEIVEILDDTDDDLDIVEAGPSTQKSMKAKPAYVARDGKDFKGQKYFGSKLVDRPV